jgi:hypothetical protein
MKILEIKDMENCFDGSFMKEAIFDHNIEKNFIDYLGSYGELEYYGNFLRPFYKLSIPFKFILKGVEGNNTAKVVFSRSNIDDSMKFLNMIAEKFMEEDV